MSNSQSFEETYLRMVYKNSFRLREDAEVILRSGKYQSATALAILAIEEFGKYLISLWSAKNKASRRKHPSHIEKQSATFALLAAKQILAPEAMALMKEMDAAGDPYSFTALGGHSEQFAFCRSGFYENLRISVTYADETPIYKISDIAESILAGVSRELLEFFDEAVKARDDDAAMQYALILYENDLGRL